MSKMKWFEKNKRNAKTKPGACQTAKTGIRTPSLGHVFSSPPKSAEAEGEQGSSQEKVRQ